MEQKQEEQEPVKAEQGRGYTAAEERQYSNLVRNDIDFDNPADGGIQLVRGFIGKHPAFREDFARRVFGHHKDQHERTPEGDDAAALSAGTAIFEAAVRTAAKFGVTEDEMRAEALRWRQDAR